MISKEELESEGLTTENGFEYYDYPTFDFMFDVKQQQLFTHCEVTGKVDYLCPMNNIEKLKEIILL